MTHRRVRLGGARGVSGLRSGPFEVAWLVAAAGGDVVRQPHLAHEYRQRGRFGAGAAYAWAG